MRGGVAGARQSSALRMYADYVGGGHPRQRCLRQRSPQELMVVLRPLPIMCAVLSWEAA